MVYLNFYSSNRKHIDAGDVDVAAGLHAEHEPEDGPAGHRGADDEEPQHAVVGEAVRGQEHGTVNKRQVKDIDT